MKVAQTVNTERYVAVLDITRKWRGNYFWTGGHDRERQSREREIKVFAVFVRSEKKRSPKNKKGLRRIRSVFLP